ncbi:MAG: hypothetical protein ABSA83_18895 [Verrucomicrobiota bacterium]|jgi:hypothetical protein
MKRAVTFLLCIAPGIAIGWYFGYTRPMAREQRELLAHSQYIRDHFQHVDSDVTALNKSREDYIKAIKPYMAESASMALAALQRLDGNDLRGARSTLVAEIANYYRGHSRDGDTNLLARITALAAKDAVLSNAIYKKSP